MSKQRGIVIYALLVALIVLAVAVAAASHYRDAAKSEKKLREDTQATLNLERTLRGLSNDIEAKLTKDLADQQEKAHATDVKLRKALATGPDCKLPAAAGGVLRDVSEAAARPASAGAGEAAAQGDPAGADRAGAAGTGLRPVSCRAVAVWAERNINEVLIPNALQTQHLQDYFERVRGKLNEASRP